MSWITIVLSPISKGALLIALFVSLSLPLTGLAFAAQPPNGDAFVGRVDGTDAFIAVIADDSNIRAYVCDDDVFGDWFFGTRNNTELVSASGSRLIVAFDGERARGVFTTAEGVLHSYSADPPGGEAAWYRGESESGGISYVAGWIVLPDGATHGFIQQNSQQQGQQAPPLTPRLSTGTVTPGNFPRTVPGNGIIAILIGM